MEFVPLVDYKLKKPIIVFDSGVGGLTIYQNLIADIKNWPIIYFLDNEGFPYGTKTVQEVKSRVKVSFSALVKYIDPVLVVIACNTASTVALPLLREMLPCPVVGVVPAIKRAACVTKTGFIGLLATPATIKRKYTHDLISKFANHCNVIKVGSLELVMESEKKLRGIKVDQQLVEDQISSFFMEKKLVGHYLDCIVLGCTHFPLLENEIQKALNKLTDNAIQLIDSSAAVVKQIIRILKLQEPSFVDAKNFKRPDVDYLLSNRIVFTKRSLELKKLKNVFNQLKIGSVSVISLHLDYKVLAF